MSKLRGIILEHEDKIAKAMLAQIPARKIASALYEMIQPDDSIRLDSLIRAVQRFTQSGVLDSRDRTALAACGFTITNPTIPGNDSRDPTPTTIRTQATQSTPHVTVSSKVASTAAEQERLLGKQLPP